MFSTKINGDLFIYNSWEPYDTIIGFHKDALHMSYMVFYNQSLQMSGREYLTPRQWMWHVACLEAYRRSNYNDNI